MSNTQERVFDIVSQQMGIAADALTTDTRLREDLGVDSLDLTELVIELEEEFDKELPDELVEEVETLGHIIQRLEDDFEV